MQKTVIISCAGIGSRLGFELPKCLVEIDGVSLIERLLNQLSLIDDIRIVVGYKSELVINKVKSINPNVKFYYNNDYKTTGTAASLCTAIDESCSDLILAIDGDLLINSIDMENIISSDYEFICGEEVNTSNPVLISLDENNDVCKFSREEGIYEWSGIAQFLKKRITKSTNHVYQMLEPLLPMHFKLIRVKEIDDINDYNSAFNWVKNNTCTKEEVMDNWFKSRFNIENRYETSRHNINDRIKYDIDLIQSYVSSTSRVLDLGCGTGIIEDELYSLVEYIKAVDKYQEFIDRGRQSENIDYEKKDIVNYFDDSIYDLIILFGVSIYLDDKSLLKVLKNCLNMMNDKSILIIKNQWSLDIQDKIINKEYSKENHNMYFCIFRSLERIIELLSENNLDINICDLYPSELNNYSDTHEYALICRKLVNKNEEK